jgi:hypothetical protein
MRLAIQLGLILGGMGAGVAAPEAIKVSETADYVQIETDALKARINKKGYVSGTAAGGLLDRNTGARDAGFGLHIMDFLLGPGWKDDDYGRNVMLHGNLPKHYIEGPQICTQAKKLEPEIIRGQDFVAVRLRYRFTKAAAGYKPGSLWEQTLLFQPGLRYYLSSEKITSANDVDNVFYRIDMPGHVRHKGADSFSEVYLSYHGLIPASAFAQDFAPDARYLYQRSKSKGPKRMIRAYHLNMNGTPGPWVAGMTLDPTAVSEAWCHERGYVCFIQELHGRPVKAGESFGAAYVVGFFDNVQEMEKTYDRFRGTTGIAIKGGRFRLE